MVLPHPELLDIFMTTTPTFNWRPNFPERGLDAVLREVHHRFPKWRRNYEEGPDPTRLMAEVAFVRDKLHELGLPKDEVLVRLEVMGMLEYWSAMVAYAGEPPEGDEDEPEESDSEDEAEYEAADDSEDEAAGAPKDVVFQDDLIRFSKH